MMTLAEAKYQPGTGKERSKYMWLPVHSCRIVAKLRHKIHRGMKPRGKADKPMIPSEGHLPNRVDKNKCQAMTTPATMAAMGAACRISFCTKRQNAPFMRIPPP